MQRSIPILALVLLMPACIASEDEGGGGGSSPSTRSSNRVVLINSTECVVTVTSARTGNSFEVRPGRSDSFTASDGCRLLRIDPDTCGFERSYNACLFGGASCSMEVWQLDEREIEVDIGDDCETSSDVMINPSI